MRNKTLERLLVILILLSMVLTGGGPLSVLAQDEGRGAELDYYAQKAARSREKIENRVTQAEREAAAARSAAQGFVLPTQATEMLPSAAPHYFSHPNYANSPLRVPTTAGYCSVTTTTPCSYNTECPAGEVCVGAAFSGGIRKFVDKLPWAKSVDPASTDLPLASKTVMPDLSEYYEIGLIQYRQILHSDLAGPTGKGSLLRGYVQLTACANPGAVPLFNEMLDGTSVATGFCGVTAPTYLGPAIIATKDVPVRILFRNLLPAGAGGNLFIPTDVSVMGAGMGPDLHGMPEVDPQHPTCEAIPKPVGCFTENRADLHLHGGLTPWISDGTPHQWITPATELLPYPDADLVALGQEEQGLECGVRARHVVPAERQLCPGLLRPDRPALRSRRRPTTPASEHRPTTTPTSRAPGCSSTTTTRGVSPA